MATGPESAHVSFVSLTDENQLANDPENAHLHTDKGLALSYDVLGSAVATEYYSANLSLTVRTK